MPIHPSDREELRQIMETLDVLCQTGSIEQYVRNTRTETDKLMTSPLPRIRMLCDEARSIIKSWNEEMQSQWTFPPDMLIDEEIETFYYEQARRVIVDTFGRIFRDVDANVSEDVIEQFTEGRYSASKIKERLIIPSLWQSQP